MCHDETTCWPDWVPKAARNYVLHTEGQDPIRALARASGAHASTILRQIRRIEALRDDPLCDAGVQRLARTVAAGLGTHSVAEGMTLMTTTQAEVLPSDLDIEREGRRVLRRLNEAGACLAIAKDMDRAVIVKDATDGQAIRTAVVERPIAEAMALRDWIKGEAKGRIHRYHITAQGRAALRRMIAADEQARGMAEAATPFAGQHQSMADRDVGIGSTREKLRYNMAESPLTLLARRTDKRGKSFLSDELVAAGERLREDFELAQMGPRVTQNWDKFLVGGGGAPGQGDGRIAEGPSAARERVAAALEELGPGLGDVVLRCCCFLEGMEATEKHMGWSARSGKIVLRIALQRLRRFYDSQGSWSQLIG
ncbi:MAG: helix-turn-helix domain-containing protein [Rhodobacteraceae bacterium]|nr:helix-turn-helix domain-containing protein [Paracoccaceae bacterium]